jgi:hypothetical protein
MVVLAMAATVIASQVAQLGCLSRLRDPGTLDLKTRVEIQLATRAKGTVHDGHAPLLAEG